MVVGEAFAVAHFGALAGLSQPGRVVGIALGVQRNSLIAGGDALARAYHYLAYIALFDGPWVAIRMT
ncbi:hypothetical protein [Mycobacterium sp. DL592]|uniref:hypothetical protein n=1 Tax=Mycobacterium sp. DL592 TaxID=2675524 RepID=UPI0014229737|nr:hypothetical protein [Mycobacterium sp. DL592]